MRLFFSFACLVVLTACQSAPIANVQSCTEGTVQLFADFEGARASDCKRDGPASFRISISPEAIPINPSPWYAFDIIAEQDTAIAVRLDYTYSKHRYIPKASYEDGSWKVLGNVVRVTDDGAVAVISTAIKAGRTRIAGQEVISFSDRVSWAKGYAERAGYVFKHGGDSVQGRPIYVLHKLPEERDVPLIIILGGQHSPEIPGTLAMQAFMEALLEDRSGLLNDYEVVIFPELNPDGLVAGNWRLNANGVDLNRDWGPFAQPETRIVRDTVDELVQRGFVPTVLLDFHATRRNVFYTPTGDLALQPANFSDTWLRRLAEIWNGDMPGESSSHNPDLPTSKAWFAETHGAPGITVEFADEIDRQVLPDLASSIAVAFIDALRLAREDHEQ